MTIKFAPKRHSNSLNRSLNFKLIVVFQMSRTFPLGQIVAAPYSEHGETQYYRARVDSYDQQKRQERRIDTATVSINENSECFSLPYNLIIPSDIQAKPFFDCRYFLLTLETQKQWIGPLSEFALPTLPTFHFR